MSLSSIMSRMTTEAIKASESAAVETAHASEIARLYDVLNEELIPTKEVPQPDIGSVLHRTRVGLALARQARELMLQLIAE